MRQNIVYNPSFRYNDAYWATLNGAAATRSDAEAFVGTHSLRVTKSLTADNGIVFANPLPAVVAASTYAFSAYLKVPDTSTYTLNAKLLVSWYSDAIGGTQVGTTVETAVLQVYPGEDWARLGGTFASPLGATHVKLAVVSATPDVEEAAGTYFYVDAVLVERSATVNQYIDELTQDAENTAVNSALRPVPNPYITGMQLNADVSLNGVIFNTIDENNTLWVCTNIDGWWGLPDPEIQDIPRGLGDGSYDVRGRYAARQITFEGVFIPADPSYVQPSRERLVKAIDMVYRAGWLITDENPPKAARVRLSGRPSIDTVNPRGRTEFSIGLRAADPIKYEWIDGNPDGYDVAVIQANESATLVNRGNTPVTALFELRGPLTENSYVSNDTTGGLITLVDRVYGRNNAAGSIVRIGRAEDVAELAVSTTFQFAPGNTINVVGLSNTSFNGTDLEVVAVDYSADNYTLLYYNNPGSNVSATNVTAGVVQRAEPDVLSVDTYNREVAYNGFVEGNRSKIETLVDWITLQPGNNVIALEFAPIEIISASRISNVTTLTTAETHALSVGDSVTVAGVGASFNGVFTVTAVPTASSFSYANTGGDSTLTGLSGELRSNEGSLTVYYRSGWIG